MKKPHEQEWRTAQDDGETACAVYDASGRMVADLRIHYEVEEESARARFIAAAPDMARALLRNLHACSNTGSRTKGCDEAGVMNICAACETKAALKKAGVL